MRRLVNPVAMRLGGPTLIVRGRTTGRPVAALVPPFALDGVSYLVAGGGETHWVRNLRAAGQAELRRGRQRTAFRAIELTGTEQVRVVIAYRVHMGRRAKMFFDALPEPLQHPVFRIEPLDPAGAR